jgi:hypothetical protein
VRVTSFIFAVFSALSLTRPSVKGQSVEPIQQWAEKIAVTYAEEVESEDMTILVEDLLSLSESPLNINTAKREDLERIFFLTDMQIENILFRRYVNGPFFSIYELQSVEGLPVETIKMLERVIYFGEEENKKPSFKLWGNSFFRVECQIEKASGFKETEEGGTPPYKGNPLKLYSRTEFKTNSGFSAGIIVKKDPGEPAFSHDINGFDLMTGYMHFKSDNSWIKEVVLGQYQVRTGQGLVLQSGLPMRKSSLVTNIRNRRPAFRPSLSASESSGMQGGYFTLRSKYLEITPFVSLKKRDGRFQTDSTVTSLCEDGMHRTETEIEQRHNVKELVIGSRVSCTGKWFNVEAGHVLYQLNYPVIPEEKLYNKFYFRGKESKNSWLAYMMSFKNFLVFGEMGVNSFQHASFCDGLEWSAAPAFTLSVTHRLIPIEYRAPLAGPMTESSSFSGEEGIYTGVRWQLPSGINLLSYFDWFRFQWLKYQIDAPASGFDWLTQAEKQFFGDALLVVKYRHREKPHNTKTDLQENIVAPRVYDQLKLQYRHHLESGWQFTTMGQWNFVDSGGENYSGNMLSEDLKWANRGETLTITVRYALFSTEDYLARVYAYEPNVLYMFSVPAFSGKGSRYILMANCKIRKNLHIWLRAGRWHYSDREQIGSGTQMVNSDKKTTVTAQVRFKF